MITVNLISRDLSVGGLVVEVACEVAADNIKYDFAVVFPDNGTNAYTHLAEGFAGLSFSMDIAETDSSKTFFNYTETDIYKVLAAAKEIYEMTLSYA